MPQRMLRAPNFVVYPRCYCIYPARLYTLYRTPTTTTSCVIGEPLFYLLPLLHVYKRVCVINLLVFCEKTTHTRRAPFLFGLAKIFSHIISSLHISHGEVKVFPYLRFLHLFAIHACLATVIRQRLIKKKKKKTLFIYFKRERKRRKLSPTFTLSHLYFFFFRPLQLL